jgi:hypothetical protein
MGRAPEIAQENEREMLPGSAKRGSQVTARQIGKPEGAAGPESQRIQRARKSARSAEESAKEWHEANEMPILS